MKKTVLDPEDWSLIVDRIQEGLCVPFLGAGANVTSGEYKGLPLGSDVALRIVEMWMDLKGINLKDLTEVNTHEKITQSAYCNDLTRLALQNLARVSLYVEFRHDFGRLIKYLRKIIPDEKCEPSPLLQTLAKLPSPNEPTSPPFQLIVTTNYDRLLEQALETNKRDYRVVVQPIEGFSPDSQEELEELAEYDGIVVYKIHGTFENEDSIIITEEDYIKFLLTAVQRKRGIPSLIRAKLVDSTLLFLGYSLEDWDFRTIFKGLIETLPDRKKRKSFAIQRYPTGFWVDFWDDKGVQIRDVDLYEFAEDLELCFGVEQNEFLKALSDEFAHSVFDLISARRAYGKTWRDFAYNMVQESTAKREAANLKEVEPDGSRHWDDFLRKHNISQIASSDKSEGT